LLGATEHDRTAVAVLTEGIEQGAGKAKVALHELFLVLGAVHAGQVKDKVGLAAPLVQLLGGAVQVVLIDGLNGEGRESAVFAVLDIAQGGTEVLAHEPLGSGN